MKLETLAKSLSNELKLELYKLVFPKRPGQIVYITQPTSEANYRIRYEGNKKRETLDIYHYFPIQSFSNYETITLKRQNNELKLYYFSWDLSRFQRDFAAKGIFSKKVIEALFRNEQLKQTLTKIKRKKNAGIQVGCKISCAKLSILELKEIIMKILT